MHGRGGGGGEEEEEEEERNKETKKMNKINILCLVFSTLLKVNGTYRVDFAIHM